MRRILVGVFATIGFLVALLAVGAAVAWWALKPQAAAVPASTILALDLTERLPEGPSGDALAGLLFEERPSLRKVLDGIERAAGDTRVKAIFARVGGDDYGFGAVQELRDAIIAFRATGKQAVAFSDSFGEFGPGTRSYYLASAFDEIWLQPLGGVNLTGLRSESPFFRGTLDKLGVEPRLDHRSEYKTAMNMVTETAMTPAHREELDAILQSISGQIVRDVAKARRLDEAAASKLVGGGPYLDRDAERARLIDHVGYRDQALGSLQERVAAKPQRLAAYLDAAGSPNEEGARVALIYGAGIIARGPSHANPLTGGGVMGAETVVRAFRAATADPKVRAILFRVDSQGGSAVASETIWRAAARAREAGKKLIVSMGDVAGSGGYYIAAGADKIVAHPATLTGSIGVVAGKMLTGGFWEKLGVTWGAVQIGENAGMFSTLEDWTPEQKQLFETSLDAIYAGFKSRVAEGRRLSADAVEAVAKGRVWTGEQAKERGLVDALGGYTEALRLTREAIGVAGDAPIELKVYPEEEGAGERLLARLLGREGGDESRDAALRPVLSALAPVLRRIELLSAGPLAAPAVDPR
jgi:protease-4